MLACYICFDCGLQSFHPCPSDISTACRVDEASQMDLDAYHIYLLNCGAAIESVLMGHACCANRRQQMTALLTRQMDALVHGQVSRVLAACNFAEIVERIR